MQLFLLWGVLLIPLSFSHSTSHAVVFKDYLVFWLAGACFPLALVVCIAGYAGVLSRGSAKIFPAVLLPALCFWFYQLVRTAGSGYPHVSWPSWTWQFACMFLWIPFALTARSPGFVRLWYRLVLGVLTLVSLYAWVQVLGLDPWPWDRFTWALPIRRVCGTFANPTFFASYLVLMLPLLAVAYAWVEGWQRWGVMGLSLLSVSALVFTFSRGAMAGATVAAAVILIGAWNHGGRAQHTVKRVMIWGVVIVIAIFVLCVTLVWVKGIALAALGPGLHNAFGASLPIRLLLFRGACRMVLAHPWWGWGQGLFCVHYPQFRDPELAWWEPPSETFVGHAHCEYLETAVDLGLVGLGLWLWLVGSVLWVGLKRLKTSHDRNWWLVLGIVAALSAQLAMDLVSVTMRWTSTAFAFWMLAGVLVGLADKPINQSARVLNYRHAGVHFIRRNFITAVECFALICLAMLAVTFFTAKPLGADLAFKQSQDAILEGQQEIGLERLRRCLQLDPHHAQGRYALGANLCRLGKYEAAAQEYALLRTEHGEVANVVYNQGTALLQLAMATQAEDQKHWRLTQAAQCYQEALTFQPYLPEAHMSLAQAYDLGGQRALAHQHLEIAIDLFNRHLKLNGQNRIYRLQLARCYLARGELMAARKHVEKALKQNDHDELAQRLLDEIRQRELRQLGR